MLRGVAVGFLLVLSLAAVGATRAQEASTPEPCFALGRETASRIPDGVRVSGGAGQQVTESFALPEGTVIYAYKFGYGDDSAQLVPAPGGNARGTVLIEGRDDPSGSGAATVYEAGSFVLDVDAHAPWSVSFEF